MTGTAATGQAINHLYKLQVPTSPPPPPPTFAYTPIRNLNSFTKDWCLKARVTLRHQLRPTAKGSTMLKFVLMDSEGTEIEVTAFG